MEAGGVRQQRANELRSTRGNSSPRRWEHNHPTRSGAFQSLSVKPKSCCVTLGKRLKFLRGRVEQHSRSLKKSALLLALGGSVLCQTEKENGICYERYVRERSGIQRC